MSRDHEGAHSSMVKQRTLSAVVYARLCPGEQVESLRCVGGFTEVGLIFSTFPHALRADAAGATCGAAGGRTRRLAGDAALRRGGGPRRQSNDGGDVEGPRLAWCAALSTSSFCELWDPETYMRIDWVIPVANKDRP